VNLHLARSSHVPAELGTEGLVGHALPRTVRALAADVEIVLVIRLVALERIGLCEVPRGKRDLELGVSRVKIKRQRSVLVFVPPSYALGRICDMGQKNLRVNFHLPFQAGDDLELRAHGDNTRNGDAGSNRRNV